MIRPLTARHLSETDALNGVGNRFFWPWVERSKFLPEGGSLHTQDLNSLVHKIRQAVDVARKTSLIEKTEEARGLWGERYRMLIEGRSGLFAGLTDRSEAQVMRLALAYALLDCSPQIDVVHLEAALALWDYCLQSTRFIFGESLGDKLADRLLDEIRRAGSRGLTRNAMREKLHGNTLAAKLDAALDLLEHAKLASSSKAAQGANGGRPPTIWKATPYAINAVNATSNP